MKLPGGKTYFCQQGCSMPRHVDFISFLLSIKWIMYSDQPHDVHSCDMRLCPVTCDLCRRLCIQPHLHGLVAGSFHLCGSVFVQIEGSFELKGRSNREAHPCSALCPAPGICQIDTAPLSVEATFTGRHETFQYTKVREIIAFSPLFFFLILSSIRKVRPRLLYVAPH